MGSVFIDTEAGSISFGGRTIAAIHAIVKRYEEVFLTVQCAAIMCCNVIFEKRASTFTSLCKITNQKTSSHPTANGLVYYVNRAILN